MARSLVTIRTGTAQATTGQTDEVGVPPFATQCTLYLNVTAVAGTTPLTDFKVQYEHPVTGEAVDTQWNGITQIVGTTAANVVIHWGQGYDTEDDTGPIYFLKDELPAKFNAVLTFDRTTGDETYTYSLVAEFVG